jgi:hypothetical protein
MTTIVRAVIRDRRIEVEAPIELTDGTEVVLRIDRGANEDGPMSPEEIAFTLSEMKKILPLDIPEDVSADLEAWERKVNQYSIDNFEKGFEDVFQ